jgi:hypothetical protein
MADHNKNNGNSHKTNATLDAIVTGQHSMLTGDVIEGGGGDIIASLDQNFEQQQQHQQHQDSQLSQTQEANHPVGTGGANGSGIPFLSTVDDEEQPPTQTEEENFSPPEDSTTPSSPSLSSSLSSCRTQCVVCLAKWPRCMQVVQKMLLLWTLILWALCFGYCLSLFEGPGEIRSNDALMRQRWAIQALPLQQVVDILIDLPTACIEKFIDENAAIAWWNNNTSNNETTTSMTLLDLLDVDVNVPSPVASWLLLELEQTLGSDTLAQVEGILEDYFPGFELPSSPDITSNANETIVGVFESIYAYVEQCEETARSLLLLALNYTRQIVDEDLGLDGDFQLSDIGSSLTFNWYVDCQVKDG